MVIMAVMVVVVVDVGRCTVRDGVGVESGTDSALFGPRWMVTYLEGELWGGWFTAVHDGGADGDIAQPSWARVGRESGGPGETLRKGGRASESW